MRFSKNLISILFIVLLFILFLIFYSYNNYKYDTVIDVISPVQIRLENSGLYQLTNIETFDTYYSDKNSKIAKTLNITEDEAFIFGNLAKYWAKNILEHRSIFFHKNELMFYKYQYNIKLENSAFGIKNDIPTNKEAFNKQLNSIRNSKFVLLDLDTENYYPVSKENSEKYKNYIVLRKGNIKKILLQTDKKPTISQPHKNFYNSTYRFDNNKIIVSDLTTKLVPDRNCSSDICKEILFNIDNATKTIDMAIYGYSSTPAIENALKNAIKRGVIIRLVYDVDKKGNNIYPDTFNFIKNFANTKSDLQSTESNNTMHNKFYIFDNKIVITGSANLSHTDMSGFNSNAIIVINSNEVARYYKQEFEQMYAGKFHNDKISTPDKQSGEIKVFFSPQDKTIKNGILELIKQAHIYIYIPSFVITDKTITSELINAKKRGVDVKIIADALNASTKHSKNQELRNAGILAKAENYAGKMHSKTMIIDDEYLVLGSMNFSYSGENKNDENVIILHNSGAAKFYKDFFLYQWDRIPNKWLKYTPRAEGINSIGSCSDGIDNNYDGYTDMEDEACKKLQ